MGRAAACHRAVACLAEAGSSPGAEAPAAARSPMEACLADPAEQHKWSMSFAHKSALPDRQRNSKG